MDIGISGNSSMEKRLYTPDLYGKRLVLAYAPSTSADQMESLKKTISETNIYTDETMGAMLHSVAKSYFGQIDLVCILVILSIPGM